MTHETMYINAILDDLQIVISDATPELKAQRKKWAIENMKRLINIWED